MASSAAEANALKQLETLATAFKGLGPEPAREKIAMLIAATRAAVDRIAGPGSAYAAEISRALVRTGYENSKLPVMHGVVLSLEQDIRSGFLRSMAEFHHSEVFADYLEMSEHLCGEGFKDAAAVIAGSSLESHLRRLAVRESLSPVRDDGRPKKADALNAELANTGVYNRLDQKAVTAWLDLRNKAAHGHYEEYSKDQVAHMIMTVRDFMTRHPA